MQVLVLGAGFGGLELCSTLSEQLGTELDVVLVDRGEGFVFGFSKLEVMFGRREPAQVFHSYSDLRKPGLRFIQTTVRRIDAAAKHVDTDAGAFDPDILVVALGAEVEPTATPGLVEAGHEFYTVDGAYALRDVLTRFDGGDVIVGVASTPFKCPPAPSETALLMHDFLVERGIRERSTISLVMPLGTPIPPSPPASEVILAAFSERAISWHPQKLVHHLDSDRKVAVFSDGSELAFDLFLGVPVHRAPTVVEESGLAVDGWIPVDSLTMETRFPDVYAIGDVTSIGTPKAGVFSEGQAAVLAERIIARFRGEEALAKYGGRGSCYLEFGGGLVGRVTVTFVSGQAPVGDIEGPSREIALDKVEFAARRIGRWFDRP